MRQRRRAIVRICLSDLLFVLLFTALFVGLTLWRVNDTILSAKYYDVPLSESGFYEFLMTEAVPSALNESGIEEYLTGDSLNLSTERLASCPQPASLQPRSRISHSPYSEAVMVALASVTVTALPASNSPPD